MVGQISFFIIDHLENVPQFPNSLLISPPFLGLSEHLAKSLLRSLVLGL